MPSPYYAVMSMHVCTVSYERVVPLQELGQDLKASMAFPVCRRSATDYPCCRISSICACRPVDAHLNTVKANVMNLRENLATGVHLSLTDLSQHVCMPSGNRTSDQVLTKRSLKVKPQGWSGVSYLVGAAEPFLDMARVTVCAAAKSCFHSLVALLGRAFRRTGGALSGPGLSM